MSWMAVTNSDCAAVGSGGTGSSRLLSMSYPCACKGIRRCAVCQEEKGATPGCRVGNEISPVYVYCYECQAAYRSSATDELLPPDLASDQGPHCRQCLGRDGDSGESDAVELEGLLLWPEFVTPEEEERLVSGISSVQWIDSQSGRRKQDYGPKVNFKKQKLNLAPFSGLPKYSRFLLDRISSLPALQSFRAVELCNLEYLPERGAHIDPHMDDSWLWGQRLISVNLLSDTMMCMTPCDGNGVEVWAAMPRRSLFVMQRDARYKWKHAIRPEHVMGRRLVMTFRELSPEFVTGNGKETGQELLRLAYSFQG